MPVHRARLAAAALLAAAIGGAWLPARAQKYPDHFIRYIATDQPGSSIDVLARIVGQKLAEVLGQQVVVDNRAGASGNIGADYGARAPADGYTVVQLASTHAVNATMYKNLSYNMLRDFAPVTLLASGPSIVVVPADSPVKSVADLIRLAREKKGDLQYASAGTGTCTFLSAELFKQQAGIGMQQIPYKGGGPAMTSTMAGETALYFAPLAAALPQIRQGRLRGLAVTSPQRLALVPDVPTVAEAGVPGYQFSCWYGMLVPAATPKPIVATLHDATVKVLNDPAIKKRLEELGYLPGGDTPESFGAFLHAEVESARQLVKDLPAQ
jgi:tripartite-type tricarboxylate transporter receptor subunit TctC